MRLTALPPVATSLAVAGCGGDENLTTPATDAAKIDVAQLPAQCACGDKNCNAACAENVTTCPLDCAACGDGTCSAGEGPTVCPTECCGTCGDGQCKGFACGESATSCAKDCSTACGNGKCEPGESPVTCKEDCKFKTCGNSFCEPDDGGPKGCPEDCKPGCGNCTCDKDEDWSNCPTDCGYCGDGICSTCAQNSENAASCGVDCKAAECLPNAPGACDDGILCTTEGCTQNGVCVHALNTAPCSDDNVCTVGDVCSKGTCLPGTATQDCDDGNPCTADPCDIKIGCEHNAVLGQACDDGNARTKDDLCTGGFCSGGSLQDCNDGNPCTTDGCNGVKGCTTANNKATCSDADVCTDGDGCEGGVCKPGTTLACDDNNECTADSCNPKKGCAHLPNTAKCDDGDACTDDSCIKPGGTCTATQNKAACSDNNPCTSGDSCDKGKCIGGKPTLCDDGNDCTTDSCDKAKGCATAPATGAVCDAGACTIGDKCQNGVCTSGQKGKLFESKFAAMGASNQWVTDVVAFQDGSVGVVGYAKVADYDGFAAKYDATGKELWKTFITGNTSDGLNAAVVAPDQTLVVAGVRTPVGGVPSQLYVRFDGTGNAIATKTNNFGDYSGVYDLRADAGTAGFVATGYVSQGLSNMGLFRLSGDLSPLSQTAWGGGGGNNTFGKGVVVGQQNDYFTAGFYTHPTSHGLQDKMCFGPQPVRPRTTGTTVGTPMTICMRLSPCRRAVLSSSARGRARALGRLMPGS